MYFSEIIYRFSDAQLMGWSSPFSLFAVVELSDPAICGYYRYARVGAVMFGYESNCSLACFRKVIDHSLNGQPLSKWHLGFIELYFQHYVFHVVILYQSVDICWVDSSIDFHPLEVDELFCVVRISDSASFRNYHSLASAL